MYICDKCGELVDEVPTHTEYEECWGHLEPFEYVDDCNCGGTFVEVKYCVRCGRPMPETQEHDKNLVDKFEKVATEEYRQQHFEAGCENAEEYELCEECIKDLINMGKE